MVIDCDSVKCTYVNIFRSAAEMTLLKVNIFQSFAFDETS